MDSIKSKMMSLSQATIEATARAEIYSEEMRKTQEIADKFEEQVKKHDYMYIVHCTVRFI